MDNQAAEYSTVRPMTQGLALRFCVVEGSRDVSEETGGQIRGPSGVEECRVEPA